MEKTYAERVAELFERPFDITFKVDHFTEEDFGEYKNLNIVSARKFPKDSKYWYMLTFNECAIIRHYPSPNIDSHHHEQFRAIDELYITNPYMVFMECFYDKNEDFVNVNFDSVLTSTGNKALDPKQFYVGIQLAFENAAGDKSFTIYTNTERTKEDDIEINFDHMFYQDTDSLQIRILNISKNYPELVSLFEDCLEGEEISIRARISVALSQQSLNNIEG